MHIWQRIFDIDDIYPNLVDRQRAHGLLWINLALVAVWFSLLVVLQGISILQGNDPLTVSAIALTFAMPVICFILYRLVKTGKVQTASIIVVTLTVFAVLPLRISLATAMGFVLAVTAAGTLLGRRALLLVIGILSAAYAVALLAGVDIDFSLNTSMSITTGVLFLVEVAFLYLFSARVADLNETVLIEPVQLDHMTQMFRNLAACQDEEAVWKHVIDLVRDEFNFAFTQFYLRNEDEQTGGMRIVRTNMGITTVQTEFDLGDANVLSEAVRNRTALTVSRADNEMRRSHFLPAALSGAAIPLVSLEQVVGVMDIQSETLDQFSPLQISLLMMLGQQVTANILRIRNQRHVERSLETQQNTLESLQSRVRQLEGRSVSGLAEMTAYGFDLLSEGNELMLAHDLPDDARPALTSGEIVVESGDDGQVVNVPIKLHEEILGVMSFTVGKDLDIGVRQLEMLETVSNRLALSVEAARLYERSQAQALRESKAGEIGNVLISATDVQTVLNMAAEQFNQSLGAIHTHIYLKPSLLTNLTIHSEEAV